MALAAGFGLDFERCSPMVLAAVIEELQDQSKQGTRENLKNLARQRFG